MSKPEANTNYDRSKQSYARIPHTFHQPWESFLKSNHVFLEENETLLISSFKEVENQADVNIFLEIDFERYLNDLNFHIVNYEDFSSFKDPVETKQLILEMKGITDNVIQNLEANSAVAESISTILTLKSKITEQITNLRDSFSASETIDDFYLQTNELSTLFSNGTQLIQKFNKIVLKVRQFELFFCQDIDALQASVKIFSEEETSHEKIKELADKCSIIFNKLCENVSVLTDIKFEKENSKLVC